MATSTRTSRLVQAASAGRSRAIQRDTSNRLWQGFGKATRVLGLLQLIPALLGAQSGQLRDLFPARPTDYLTDQAGVVDGSSTARINDLASRLRAATGAELAVVTLPTIGDYAAGDVALAILRSWGVGAKAAIGDSTRNAGMVLLLVPRTGEHRGAVYLSSGLGIEGILTDAMAGRIIDGMLPELRDERYGPALWTGTQTIAGTVAHGFGVSDSILGLTSPLENGEPESPWLPYISLAFLVILIVLLALARRSGGRGGRRYAQSIFWGGGGWGGGGWGGGGGGGFGGGGFGGFGGGGGGGGGGAGRSF